MRQLSTREKILVVLTVTIALVVLLYQFGVGQIFRSWNQVSEELKAEKQRYEGSVERIMRKDSIIKRYREIERVSLGMESSERPIASQFMEYVAVLYRKLGLGNPNIEPSKRSAIEGVGDYEFLTLVVHVTGGIDKISQLLKEFESRSLLVIDVTLTLKATSDKNQISSTITVAMIVKKEGEDVEEKEEKETKPGEPRENLF